MAAGKKIIGWKEWGALPDLGVPCIKVKVDTGAKTSALHADEIEVIEHGDGRRRVRFKVDALKRGGRQQRCEADVVDTRVVRSSTGVATERPVIITRLQIDAKSWPIEVTLINRDIMGFRMLVGRQALGDRFWVDPGSAYLTAKPAHTLASHTAATGKAKAAARRAPRGRRKREVAA